MNTNAHIQYISFDTKDGDYTGANLHDWFDGSELLAHDPANGIRTIVERINASFASRALAMDWLRKSYRGKDADGIGVLVDGEAFDG
jgi:hypothetical protein